MKFSRKNNVIAAIKENPINKFETVDLRQVSINFWQHVKSLNTPRKQFNTKNLFFGLDQMKLIDYEVGICSLQPLYNLLTTD